MINNDHNPLEGLLREDKPVPPMASGRILRWALALSAYEYTFKYKSEEKMGNADAKSRLQLSLEPADVPMPADVVCLLEFIDSSPIDVGMIKHWTDKDALLSRVRRFVSSDGLNPSAMMQSSDRTSVDKRNYPFRVVAYFGVNE